MNSCRQRRQAKLLLAGQLAAASLLLLIDVASLWPPLAAASPEEPDYLSTFRSRALVRVWPGFGPQLDCAKACFEIEETYDRSRRLGKLVVNAGGERSELYVRANEKFYLEAHFASNASLVRCNASQARPDDGYFGIFAKVARLAEKQAAGELGYFIGPSALLYLFRDQLRALWSDRQAHQVRMAAANANETDREPAEAITEYNREESKRRKRLFVQQDPIELDLLEDRNLKVSFKLAKLSLDRSPLLAKLAPYLSFTDSSDQTYQVDYLSIEENLNLTEVGAKDPFHLPAGGFACAASKLIKGASTKWKRDGGSKAEQRPAALLTGLTFELAAEDSWTTSWPIWANRMELISDQMWAKIYSLALYPQGVELALETEKHKFRFDIVGHSKNVLDLRRNLIFHLPDEPLIQTSKSGFCSSSQSDNDTDQISPADSEKIGQAMNSECSILTANELFGEVRSLERESLATFSSVKRWHFFGGATNSIMYLGKSRHESGHLAHEFELSYSRADQLPAFFMFLLAKDWRQVQLQGSSLFLGAKLHILADSCPVDLYELTSSCANPVFLAFRLELIELQTMKLQRSEQIRFNEFHWSLAEAVGRRDGPIIGTQSGAQLFDLSRCPLSKLELQFEVRWMETVSMGREAAASPAEAAAKTGPRRGLGQCRRSGLKSLDEFVAYQWALWQDSYFGPDYLLVGFDRRSIAGTKVAKYSIELAEGPAQVLSFSQDLSGSEQVVTTLDQRGLKSWAWAGAKLVAHTDDTRTLFECLTWASRSSAGQAVLRSPETGECLLFAERGQSSETGTPSMSPDGNNEEMRPDSNEESPAVRSIKSAARYNVYTRKVAQPETSAKGPREKGPVYKSLAALDQAILKSSEKANNFQACIEPTRYARDIRFGRAKLGSSGASLFGPASFRSLPHKRGYRFTLADSTGKDPAGSKDAIDCSTIGGSLKTQQRALEEVSSFAQCSIACDKEASCIAFAFCDYPESGHQYCQLSSLTLKETTSSIAAFRGDQAGGKSNESLLVRDANCDIHAKDYLMYFQMTDSRELANELRDSSDWLLVAKGVTQLGCASSCYRSQAGGNAPPDGDTSLLSSSSSSSSSSPSESCMRFVHCQELDWCFHHLTDTREPNESELNATKNALDTLEASPNFLNFCRRFKRKASSLYERTMSHVDHEWTGENLLQAKTTYLNKGACADMCTKLSECQSFDECRIVMTSKSKQRKKSPLEADSSAAQPTLTECVQLGGSVYDSVDENGKQSETSAKVMRLVNSTIRSEMYEVKRYCDHFERLAAKRRLSAKQVGELFRQASSTAAPGDNDYSDNTDEGELAEESSSYATKLFCAALLGLTFGLLAQGLKLVWSKRPQANGTNGSN